MRLLSGAVSAPSLVAGAVLAAYLLFGLGYIGYMTFVVTMLREQQLEPALVTSFYAMLGLSLIHI